MRIKPFFLLLFLTVFCNSKEEKSSLSSSLKAELITFPLLDPFSTRISHVADDTLFFVDEAVTTLSKFSLMDQSLSQVELKLIGDFRPSMLHYISADSILFYDGARLLLYLGGGDDQQVFPLFEGLAELEGEVYAEYPYE
jgi:hypothetical protein